MKIKKKKKEKQVWQTLKSSHILWGFLLTLSLQKRIEKYNLIEALF